MRRKTTSCGMSSADLPMTAARVRLAGTWPPVADLPLLEVSDGLIGGHAQA